MANVHVVSCGTSVLGNYLRYRSSFPALPAEVTTIDQLVAALNSTASLFSDAERIALEEPFKYFAELAAMEPYLEKGEVDTVYLVITKTAAAQLSVRLLQRFFEQRGISVDQGAQFAGYEPGSDESEEDRILHFAADLQVLRAKTLSYVRRRQKDGDTVFIAAQGGYKPEAGIMMLVGAETQATTYYAHEQMRRTVTIPLLSYRGNSEALRAIAQAGGHIAGGEATALWKQHRASLLAAEDAYAVQARRDKASGEVIRLKLTDYGKFLAEEVQ